MALLHVSAKKLERYEVDILALAVGTADPARMAHVVDAYDSNEAWSVHVYRAEMTTLGMIGCEQLQVREARIRHIAVDPTEQRGGLGRLMVEAAVQELGFHVLRAETDSDAVGFYAACSFNVESLGEKYPGVERFECTFRAVV